MVDHLNKFNEVVEISEEYTSGVDSVRHEYPSKDNYEPWKRIKRGLFKSIRMINADVNAARNIIKKYLLEIGRTDHPSQDTASGLKQVIRLRVFRKLGSSKSAMLGQIGVASCVPLVAVRLIEQTRPEAPCVSEG